MKLKMLISINKVSFGTQPCPFVRELSVSACTLRVGQQQQRRATGEPHARAVWHSPEEARHPALHSPGPVLFWVLTSHCSDFLGLL